MQIGKHTIKIARSKHNKIKSNKGNRLNMEKFYRLIDRSYLLVDLHAGLAEQQFHHVWNIQTRNGMDSEYQWLNGGGC